MEKENTNFPTTSSPMPKPLSSVLNSMSASMQHSQNCVTGQAQNGLATTIGKPPSEIVLGDLRSMAQAAREGMEVSDDKLRALLQLALGSRLDIQDRIEQVYDQPGGYDEIHRGWNITLASLHDSEMALFDAVDYFNKPSNPKKIVSLVTRMRVMLMRRNEDNTDIEVLIDTLVDLCSEYPFDVVTATTRWWLKNKTFFPIPNEFIAEIEKRCQFRRQLQRAFERARNPLFLGVSKNEERL